MCKSIFGKQQIIEYDWIITYVWGHMGLGVIARDVCRDSHKKPFVPDREARFVCFSKEQLKDFSTGVITYHV